MAYCPYSGFPVGAAILTTGGAIITGKRMQLFIYLFIYFIASTLQSNKVNAAVYFILFDWGNMIP